MNTDHGPSVGFPRILLDYKSVFSRFNTDDIEIYQAYIRRIL